MSFQNLQFPLVASVGMVQENKGKANSRSLHCVQDDIEKLNAGPSTAFGAFAPNFAQDDIKNKDKSKSKMQVPSAALGASSSTAFGAFAPNFAQDDIKNKDKSKSKPQVPSAALGAGSSTALRMTSMVIL